MERKKPHVYKYGVPDSDPNTTQTEYFEGILLKKIISRLFYRLWISLSSSMIQIDYQETW
jgi:hypothetical protein